MRWRNQAITPFCVSGLVIGKQWDIVNQALYTNLFIKVVQPEGEAHPKLFRR